MSATARHAAAALAAALFVALAPAHAQVTSGGALEKVDAWGKGWLSRSEGALPTTLWSNTNGPALSDLVKSIKPSALSPAGRQALRRIILSAGKAPAAEGDLLAERVRLMQELGEGEKAIELRRLFPNAAWAKGVEIDAAERDLAAGYSQNACARTGGKASDDAAWVRVRAVCFAKAGDFNAAAAVAELAAKNDKALGAWLVQAIESMRQTTKTKPQGRFGSAFETALSIFAKLAPASDAFRNSPPDLAAMVVTHKEATPEQKRAALRAAVEAGLVKPADVRAALLANAGGKKTAKPDYVALALAAAENDKLDATAKATAYAVPLKLAETSTDFRIAAYALSADTAKLPKSDATLALAEAFARASLVAGDLKQAQDWRALMNTAPKGKADAWAAARLDLMFGYAGGNADTAVKALSTLAGALPAPDAKAAAPTRQGQADLRRIEATRALFLHVGAGRSLSPSLRTLLAAQRSTGRGVPDAALARTQAALAADAKGEAALAAIAQLGSDPSALSFSGLSQLLVALDRAGLDKDADAVALEALQVWKSF